MKAAVLDQLLIKMLKGDLSVKEHSDEEKSCYALMGRGLIECKQGYGNNVLFGLTPFGYSFIQSGGFAAEENKAKEKEIRDLREYRLKMAGVILKGTGIIVSVAIAIAGAILKLISCGFLTSVFPLH